MIALAPSGRIRVLVGHFSPSKNQFFSCTVNQRIGLVVKFKQNLALAPSGWV